MSEVITSQNISNKSDIDVPDSLEDKLFMPLIEYIFWDIYQSNIYSILWLTDDSTKTMWLNTFLPLITIINTLLLL